MSRVPVVQVVNDNDPEHSVLINESDFDPAKHTLWEKRHEHKAHKAKDAATEVDKAALPICPTCGQTMDALAEAHVKGVKAAEALHQTGMPSAPEHPHDDAVHGKDAEHPAEHKTGQGAGQGVPTAGASKAEQPGPSSAKDQPGKKGNDLSSYGGEKK